MHMKIIAKKQNCGFIGSYDVKQFLHKHPPVLAAALAVVWLAVPPCLCPVCCLSLSWITGQGHVGADFPFCSSREE